MNTPEVAWVVKISGFVIYTHSTSNRIMYLGRTQEKFIVSLVGLSKRFEVTLVAKYSV